VQVVPLQQPFWQELAVQPHDEPLQACPDPHFEQVLPPLPQVSLLLD
jgi:hypothetical protein